MEAEGSWDGNAAEHFLRVRAARLLALCEASADEGRPVRRAAIDALPTTHGEWLAGSPNWEVELRMHSSSRTGFEASSSGRKIRWLRAVALEIMRKVTRLILEVVLPQVLIQEAALVPKVEEPQVLIQEVVPVPKVEVPQVLI